MKKKSKFNLLVEDLTQQSQNFVSNDVRPQRPKQVSLLDILRSHQDQKEGNNTTPLLPQPLNNGFVDLIGDLYVKSSTIL